jgi:cold shock CspA family protein
METLEWLFKHSLRLAKIFFVIFLALVVLSNMLPATYLKWLSGKLAFTEIRLPAPRETPVARMKNVYLHSPGLQRSGFTTLIPSISIAPGQMIHDGDTLYGYARSDLFDSNNGTMWVVVRRADGVEIATGRAYTQYSTKGFGFVPFSMKVPYLIITDNCLLEFRRDYPMKDLSDILFTSMPVTCVRTETMR